MMNYRLVFAKLTWFLFLESYIDQTIKDIEHATAHIDSNVNLETEAGREAYYDVVRLSVLGSNNCLKESEVEAWSKQQGFNLDNAF